MTMLRAQIFFAICLLFAIGTGFWASRARDWATVGAAKPPRGVEAPSQDLIDLYATVTAVTRSLTPTPTPVQATPPAPGAEAVIVGAGRYRVVTVVEPEAAGLFKAPAGKHVAAVQVTVEAVGGPVNYGFTQYRVRASDGTEYSWALGNSEPKLETGTLQAGQSRTGWVAFALPDGTRITTVLVQPDVRGAKVPIATLP